MVMVIARPLLVWARERPEGPRPPLADPNFTVCDLFIGLSPATFSLGPSGHCHHTTGLQPLPEPLVLTAQGPFALGSDEAERVPKVLPEMPVGPYLGSAHR